MVVKAIINALGKGVPKPKKFPQAANLKKLKVKHYYKMLKRKLKR